MEIESGGWVNAANVVMISDTGVAFVNNPDGTNLNLKLTPDWQSTDHILEITEHPVHGR